VTFMIAPVLGDDAPLQALLHVAPSPSIDQ
jgi:hypothetical protein